MEKISIIVPVFNAGNYLCVCLDSLLSQSYQNIEIVLVDDGSTDSTASICDYYAIKYGVVVLHTENHGQSIARKKGLEIASGDYIAFMDADDVVANDIYAYLYTIIKKYDAEVAVCGFYRSRDYKTNCFDDNTNEIIQVLDRKEAIKALLKGNSISFYLWNKLYKRNVLDKVNFPSEPLFEDKYIVPDILLNSNTIVLSNKKKYQYIVRDSSSIHKYTHSTLAGIDAGEHIRICVSSAYPELYELAVYQYYLTIFLCYEILIESGVFFPDDENYLIDLIFLNMKGIFKNRYISIKRKVILILMHLDRRSYRYALETQKRFSKR